jgi:hypothetical protein
VKIVLQLRFWRGLVLDKKTLWRFILEVAVLVDFFVIYLVGLWFVFFDFFGIFWER